MSDIPVAVICGRLLAYVGIRTSKSSIAKHPKEPVYDKQDEKTLHPDYQQFFDKEYAGTKEKTQTTVKNTLLNFPPPDGLTGDYFRELMKRLSPYTLRYRVALAKKFLRWAKRDTEDLYRLRSPRLEESVTVEDLYTQEELNAIFANLTNYRDHAMISVLYESACRRSELVSMTCENLEAPSDSSIVTAIVKGKTGTREVYLKESVPALQRWLNIHPTKKGALWVDERRGHRKIGVNGLDAVVRGALEKAGIQDKKKVVHMFRHTRITELVKKGIRGQSLSKLVGWTSRSNMEAVYVHLSTADVKNEIALKIFGLDGEERPARPIFENERCPNPDCGHENPKGAARCEKCNMPLSDGLIVQQLTQKTRLEEQVSELQKTTYQPATDQDMLVERFSKEWMDAYHKSIEQYASKALLDLLTNLAKGPEEEVEEFIKRVRKLGRKTQEREPKKRTKKKVGKKKVSRVRS